ncbi:MAG: excinuclease ABC subunit UvrB [Planctomycetota bacterium]
MSEGRFKIISEFKPTGDQPEAIDGLAESIQSGDRAACLLGATGTGKTFTMANVIERVGKPTLIISHNKTLAAQLYEELRGFFPGNSVNYFVSYYDYYQPEAYIPQRDIYIEKDASRNDDLEQLRLATTSNILSRRDTIVVASVSCIFGLGSPEAYAEKVMTITKGGRFDRRKFFLALDAMQYKRGDYEFKRGYYRVRGDAVEIWPAYERFAVRVELFGDEIDRVDLVNPASGELLSEPGQFFLFPAVHYVMPEDRMQAAITAIREELDARVMELRSQGKLLEAQRLLARTKYDLEMIEEVGFCSGIENYSRFMDGREQGERPFTLLDYFDYAPAKDETGIAPILRRDGDVNLNPTTEDSARHRPNYRDWLLLIDESHVTIPQIRAMFNGDRARKEVLVEHGFRIPSALDNRPLRFSEFEAIVPQTVYVSATPAEYELEHTGGRIVEQVIRPTGLVDPEIEVRPADNQVPDLLERCRERVERGDRVLVTALTKRLCEDLTTYLDDQGFRVRYLHSEIETLERVEILTDLRSGEFDVLVGVNLLREGLDLPEVSLVAILDADKEGFLRSATSLIQQMGRAARNADSDVIMYADKITPAMKAAIGETERRRKKQLAYNQEHGIVPKTIKKEIRKGLQEELAARKKAREAVSDSEKAYDAHDLIEMLEEEMLESANKMEFEKAALLRDQVKHLRDLVGEIEPGPDDEPVLIKRSELEAALSGKGKKKKAGMAGTRSGRRKKAKGPRGGR